MEEKAVRGFSWTFLGLGLSKGLATITTIVLAALVTPADFGLVAIALVVVNFVSWFGGSSFSGTLIVHQDLDERGQGTVLSLSLLGASTAGVAILALSPVLADVLGEPELTPVLAVLTTSVVLSGLTAFYESLLQNELEFRRRFVALTTQTATFSITAIALAALGAGVWSLVVGQVLSVALFAAMLVALAPRRVAPAWDRSQVGRLFSTGRGFALQGITNFVRQNLDVLVVGRSFGAASVGFYSMAIRLGDLTYSALADPIARVTFPAFARSHARGEDVRPAFLSVLRVVALVTVPCGVILSAANGPFTRTFFQPEWQPMIAVLGVVGIWAAIRPVESTLSWLLNSLGRPGAAGRVAVFALIPLIVGLAVVIGRGNLALVAVVPLVDTIISFAILTTLVGRHGNLPATVLLRALLPIWAAGAVCWGVTRLYAEALDGAPAALALVGSAAAGAAVFLLVVALLDRALIRAVKMQGAQLVRRRRAAGPAV